MGKIIKRQVEKVTVDKKSFSLGMKGDFLIEFASDSFGPYEYKFAREDCYFSDGLNDRGTSIFPLKNSKFNNTEIFLETDDIIIATGERSSLAGKAKQFIDVINIKTEKKYRVNSKEVNLIYNTTDSIIINFIDKKKGETLILDIKTLEVKEHKKETFLAFFKCVYNVEAKTWGMLNFMPFDNEESDIEKKYKSGSYSLKSIAVYGKPKSFDREKFRVKTDKKNIDVWENSIK
ncbi:hypothetical protein LR004_00970 [Candidatus Gracilibacteria bacterium]|nr:hypothetical protein [Candidatus Gracilibacteria bacterium]